MISSTLAVDCLIDTCKGTYEPLTYSTTARDFEPTYCDPVLKFCVDTLLTHRNTRYCSHGDPAVQYST